MSYISIYNQTEILLNWFFENQASAVDIQVRIPKFIGADYKSDDWIWITKHEALSQEKAMRLLSWCRNKNCNGSDIFIRPHRHDQQPILFMDDLTLAKARMVSRKYRSIIVETSPGNTQVWLALSKSLSVRERKLAQQYISSRGLTDKGSLSGDHLGRLCGYKSQKRNFWVKYIDQSCAPLYNPILATSSTFPHGGACVINTRDAPSLSSSSSQRYQSYAPLDNPIIATPSTFPHGGACVINTSGIPSLSGSSSQSEKDFSWVLSNFRKGLSASELTELLTASASQRGKPSPAKYASRTVERAIQILT